MFNVRDYIINTSLVSGMYLVSYNATNVAVRHACYRVVLVPVYCHPSVVPVTRVAPPCHCSGSGADGDQDGAHVSADEYDVETRAKNLEAAFETLANNAINIERSFDDTSLAGSNDWRVASWMIQLKQRLDESRQWINALRLQTTYHDTDEQKVLIKQIQRTVQEADARFFAFGSVVIHQNAREVLVDLFDCAQDLQRDFGAWATRETRKNAAENPPAHRGNEVQDVNPGESLARTRHTP